MNCYLCENPQEPGSPTCAIHRKIAMARWGYGEQSVILRVAGRCTIEGECWIYFKDDGAGYPSFVSCNGRPERAHRAMLLTVRPPADPKLDAAHLCENRRCCNPDHLEWQTRAQNMSTARKRKAKPYSPICSHCLTYPKVKGQSWCQPCFNEYYRERRKCQVAGK